MKRGLALALVLLATPARADVTVGLSISIARDRGAPVVDDAWLRQQIADANHFFGPLGTTFRWTEEKELAEPHGEMHTRADRDALTPLMAPGGVVDLFVVRSLDDVDEPGRVRRGVCWTGLGGKRFVILSRIAPMRVLAHELGHFFGNPHSKVTNNVMSYERDGGTTFFDPAQKAIIGRTFAGFFGSGRLVDVGPPRRFW